MASARASWLELSAGGTGAAGRPSASGEVTAVTSQRPRGRDLSGAATGRPWRGPRSLQESAGALPAGANEQSSIAPATVCGFFEFGELTSPTGSLNGDAFRRALGRVSQSRRSVTFPCERCRLAEEWTRTVSSTIRYGPVLRRLYWEEQYLAGASNRLVKDSHTAAARRGGENYWL